MMFERIAPTALLACLIFVSNAAAFQCDIDLATQSSKSEIKRLPDYDTSVKLAGPRIELKADNGVFARLGYLKSIRDYDYDYDTLNIGPSYRNEGKSVSDFDLGYMFKPWVGLKLGATYELSEGRELNLQQTSIGGFTTTETAINNYTNELYGGRLGLVLDVPIKATPLTVYGDINALFGWHDITDKKIIYNANFPVIDPNNSTNSTGFEVHGGLRLLAWQHLNLKVQGDYRKIWELGHKSNKQTASGATILIGSHF